MEKPSRVYESPEMIIETVSVRELFCTSPQPGGNEGIGYEEWGL